MPPYLTYTRFYSPEDALMLTGLLDERNIKYLLEHEKIHLDKIYIGESLDPMYTLKLLKSDFSTANQILRTQAEIDFQNPNFNSYMQSYEEGELSMILSSPNDWNAYDLRLAELLLSKKVDKIEVHHSDYKSSYEPERLQVQWLVLGYLLCFLTLVGVFIGLSITQAKLTLQNGESVNMYDSVTIGHGRTMIVLGALFSIFYVVIRLWN